ncbi:MAG: F390 synthetase-related protein [Leptotrichiaceae bacterium]|nr:CoF synthetase [Fusobacteriaceae bacterium]MBU9918469.1 CoF synthetase [Fusobacteriaceae bacterium]
MMKRNIYLLFYFLKFRYFSKFKSREKFLKWQRKKVNKYVKKNLKNYEFYKNYKAFEEIPIVDKKAMMSDFYKFNKYKLSKEEILPILHEAERTRNFTPKIKGLTIGLSSGTSGNSGIFLISEKEEIKWRGIMVAKLLPSIMKKEKIAFFLRANSNLYETLKSKRIKFKFFDLFEDYKMNVKELDIYSPTMLVAPAQVLKLIATDIVQGVVKINPQKVISIAEVLTKEDKLFLESVFKVKIDQIYQSTEGFLAFTCKYGNLHLNEDAVLFEREYIDEKRFIPIITDFLRDSQAMVRYRLNDVLVEKTGKCDCGSVLSMIEEIEGREDDIFKFKNINGEIVNIFSDFLRRAVISTDLEIEEYQIVKEKNKIKIYVEPNKYYSNVEKNIENLLNQNNIIDYELLQVFEKNIDLTKKKRRVYVID